MSLDFLEFSYPVKKNLVDQMSNTDLVRVSLQSQRADKALKECGKNNVSFYDLDALEIEQLSSFDQAEMFFLEAARQGSLPEWPIKLTAQVSKEFSFELRNNEKRFNVSIECDLLKNIDSYDGVLKNLMIGDHFVPIVIMNRRKLISFWNNQATGWISILQFISDTHGLPISSLNIHGCKSPDYSTNLRSIVRSCAQLDVCEASVGHRRRLDRNISEEDYSFIMENLRVNGVFRGYCETSNEFYFMKKINAKSIHIRYAHWFKIEHLLNGKDYTRIWVENSKFTKDEVRMFLRQWKAGEFPKLEYLSIDTIMKYPFDALGGFERHEEAQPRPQLYGEVYDWYIRGYGRCYAKISNYFSPGKFDMTVTLIGGG